MNHMRCSYPSPLHTVPTTNHRRSFVYGGTQNRNAPVPSQSLADDFRTVYILTVPAFQWLKAPNQSPIRRLAHTCKIIGKRQMISIGGTHEISHLNQQDDPWTNGLGIFDMTILNWTNAYDAAAPAYERPSLVSQFYANNSWYPIEWDDPELESIFKSSNGTATTNVSSGNIGNSTSPGTTINRTANASGGNGGNPGLPLSPTGSNGVKDVVGGVIGGAILVTLATTASLILWKRCRYKRNEKRSRNLAELEGSARGGLSGRL